MGNRLIFQDANFHVMLQITSITATLHEERWFATSEIGTDVIKHRSAEPGVGCLAFGSNSFPC